ncbi:hypothetical protein FAM09_12735 [Niastella caeni]|uniref:Uncharacterized protein n=1 Tax=Niastella caeni TaxID=2569763 RepID=A0A4S8HX76_9BACT|nr:hypothetical protein [Niastella caeni]THU39369.1 hypothetical protein FAM09_12735 [Niastella caeni]
MTIRKGFHYQTINKTGAATKRYPDRKDGRQITQVPVGPVIGNTGVVVIGEELFAQSIKFIQHHVFEAGKVIAP